MLPGLLQVDTITWAIECDLALLAATLRADAAMHRGAEALFFSLFANRATHEYGSPYEYYDTQKRLTKEAGLFFARRGKLPKNALFGTSERRESRFSWPFRSLSRKKPHKMRLKRYFSTAILM
jgi:hypothetical protein